MLTAMLGLEQFGEARVADLQQAWGLLNKVIEQKSLPAWGDVPLEVIYTTLAFLVGVQLLVALLTSRGRKVIFDTIETILAILLILVLLAVVIGLPLGIVYLTLKAASFLLSLLMGIPLIASVVGTVSGTLGY